MQTVFIDRTVTYTGLELSSGWITEQTGLEGDAAAAWLGPCNVPTENLVDLEDAAENAVIRAEQMLHVIVRVMEQDLERAVLRQRLLAALLAGLLHSRGCTQIERQGDDLFAGERKLTVSIATLGPDCSLTHLGINVEPGDAPVPAIGLNELRVEPVPLARELLRLLSAEHDAVRHALTKVRYVE